MPVPLPAFDPREFLVHRRYPLLRPRGYRAPQPDAEAYQREQKGGAAYRAELDDLDDSTVAQMVELAKAEDRDLQRQRDQQRLLQLKEYEQSLPFNRPEGTADFEHWARMATWSLAEAHALSFGREPSAIDLQQLEQVATVSEFAKAYYRRGEIIARSRDAGVLAKTVTPAVFVYWSRSLQIDLPVPLLDAVGRMGVDLTDWRARYVEERKRYLSLEADRRLLLERSTDLDRQMEELRSQAARGLASVQSVDLKPEINTNSRNSMLKLIGGMAITCYQWDPKAIRSTVSTAVVTDLATVGLSIDEDTVRKYLTESKEIVLSEMSTDVE